MKYTEVLVKTTHDEIDLVSDALFSAGAEGVKILDSADVKEILTNKSNWDYVDDNLLVESEIAVASTVVENNVIEFVEILKEELKFLGIKNCEVSTSEQDTVDWENEWKKFFKPIVTEKITVVPSWIDYALSENEKQIKLDPGMAFGTGEHATTRMCLDMLEPKDKVVLDIGCGSGILGISAKILGAKEVFMSDLDEQAVAFSKENAKSNKVDCHIECADLLAESDIKADLILANITADILIRLSKNILEHLNYGGEVIISGIIDSRDEEVVDAFTKIGLKIAERRSTADWRAYRLLWN